MPSKTTLDPQTTKVSNPPPLDPTEEKLLYERFGHAEFFGDWEDELKVFIAQSNARAVVTETQRIKKRLNNRYNELWPNEGADHIEWLLAHLFATPQENLGAGTIWVDPGKID